MRHNDLSKGTMSIGGMLLEKKEEGKRKKQWKKEEGLVVDLSRTMISLKSFYALIIEDLLKMGSFKWVGEEKAFVTYKPIESNMYFWGQLTILLVFWRIYSVKGREEMARLGLSREQLAALTYY